MEKGFYFIAQKANIPILLYGADYEKKLIQCTKKMIPSGDVDKDMREIKLYFKDFKGKNRKNSLSETSIEVKSKYQYLEISNDKGK